MIDWFALFGNGDRPPERDPRATVAALVKDKRDRIWMRWNAKLVTPEMAEAT
jgi:hypothetical protein